MTQIDSMTDPKLKEIFDSIFKYCLDNGFESFEIQAEKEYEGEIHQFVIGYQRELDTLRRLDERELKDNDDEDDIPLSPDIYSGIDSPSSSSDVD